MLWVLVVGAIFLWVSPPACTVRTLQRGHSKSPWHHHLTVSVSKWRTYTSSAGRVVWDACKHVEVFAFGIRPIIIRHANLDKCLRKALAIVRNSGRCVADSQLYHCWQAIFHVQLVCFITSIKIYGPAIAVKPCDSWIQWLRRRTQQTEVFQRLL
jgi:hypothetical protein